MNPFEPIVRKYQEPIRRFFLSQTGGNTQLSDDLAQETFIKAYSSYSRFRGDSSVLTWLYRIAYNAWYDYQRSYHVTQDVMEGEGLRKSSDKVDVGQQLDLHQALAMLSEDERTCIVLQLIEGQPIDRISMITGIKPNTVKSHLLRGKEKLVNYLRKNGYDRRR